VRSYRKSRKSFENYETNTHYTLSEPEKIKKEQIMSYHNPSPMNKPSKTTANGGGKKPMNKPSPSKPMKKKKVGMAKPSAASPNAFKAGRTAKKRAMNHTEKKERREYEGLR